MKKNVAVFLVVLASICLSYAQKVKFMVHWTEQAQWAGYYMAQKCGFYEQEGLDVDIIHPMVNSGV